MVVQTQENKKESIAKNAILNTIIVSLPTTAKLLHLVGNNAIYAYWKQSKLATIQLLVLVWKQASSLMMALNTPS